MIKKILAVLGIGLLLLAGCKGAATKPAWAGEVSISEIFSKIPAVNTGVFYNLNDSEFEFTSTFKALGYKGFNLNAGFATEETAVASLGYELIRLEKLGVEIPILKDIIIDVGWTVGLKRIGMSAAQNEFVNGPNVTLKVKF